MNLPIFSSYLVDQELNLTLPDHVLILLFAAVALVVVVAAVVVVVAAALAAHVEFWQVNAHLWKFSSKVGRQHY